MNRSRRTKLCTLLSMLVIAELLPAAARCEEKVEPVFQHAIENIDNRNLVAVVVTYPPGARSKPHRHAPSAFIFAYVLSGRILSRVDDQPARIYHEGQSFYEAPGSHHLVSENASKTHPAKLLAVFVVDPKEHGNLTTPDEK
jgi:quercetin dioxygenase-like cupin family protein